MNKETRDQISKANDKVRFFVALEFDEIKDLENQREHMPAEFDKAEVTDNAVLFHFEMSRNQTEMLRALLRVSLSMDNQNHDVNLIEEGDKRYKVR